jgi:acyl carrier protein
MVPDTEQLLLTHIRENYIEGERSVDPDTSLFRSQILDSMRLVELVGFIEETFHVSVKPMDITLENLDTVSRMVEWIKKSNH